MIREADNSAWSQRLQCFENVATRIRDFVGSSAAAAAAGQMDGSGEQQQGLLASTPEEMAALGRVLNVTLIHANDPVFRVSQAALEALVELIAARGGAEVLASHLDQMLPKLLTKLCDPKESLRNLANTALDRCREAFDPSALCASLARIFHEQPDRAKAAGLELLRVVIPSASTYLSHGAASRSLMTKLAAILASRPSLSLQRATAACAVALYHVDPANFMEHFASLAAEPQMALRRVLIAQVPEWDSRATPASQRGGRSRTGSMGSGPATAPQPTRHMSKTEDASISMEGGKSLEVSVWFSSIYVDRVRAGD